MTATIANLRKAVELSGGKLEEDEPSLDTRRLQLVAPEGKRWACDSIYCLVVLWAKRQHLESSKKFNCDAFEDALERLSYGLEDDEKEAA